MLWALIAIPMIFFSSKAGANTVNITGSLSRDGHMTIDADWTVDTAKYPGMSLDDMPEQVRSEIWAKIRSKVIARSKGMNLSYGRNHFTLLRESTDLIQKRTDGTRLYSQKIEAQFDAVASYPMTPPSTTCTYEQKRSESDEKDFVLEQHWNTEF